MTVRTLIVQTEELGLAAVFLSPKQNPNFYVLYIHTRTEIGQETEVGSKYGSLASAEKSYSKDTIMKVEVELCKCAIVSIYSVYHPSVSCCIVLPLGPTNTTMAQLTFDSL